MLGLVCICYIINVFTKNIIGNCRVDEMKMYCISVLKYLFVCYNESVYCKTLIVERAPLLGEHGEEHLKPE